MDKPTRKKLAIGVIAMLAVAFALAMLWRHTALAEVVTVDNTVEFLETIEGKWWAPLAIVLAYTPACIVMFPRPLLTIAAVMVFGMVKGFALALAGVLLSALLLYLAGRRISEKSVKRIAGKKMERITKMLRKQGFKAVAAVGLLPVAPFAAEMVVAGALRIKLRDLLLGVTVANVPGMLATTALGHQVLAALHQGKQVNRAVVILAVLMIVALFVVSHRMWRRMEAQA